MNLGAWSPELSHLIFKLKHNKSDGLSKDAIHRFLKSSELSVDEKQAVVKVFLKKSNDQDAPAINWL
ncbi:hypothetical protein B5M42_004885 [Paenibacillus athensensis]|uniref:hypothetical protein n=1 Tax=Paenibacillus athensensis TaxID=1967502 RepID=UPI00107048E1|nr:hypothetical protein [Paenibacillus athensensis]MCD1258174.1 hypothetical protein [Paenibacillus athensensis]